MLSEEAIKFDDLDDAIIGVDQRGFLVYCHEKMIDVFVDQGMTHEDAAEWIDYNVLGIMPQNYTVIFCEE